MANSSVVGLLKVLLTAETAQFEKALSGADSHVTKLANTMKRDLEPSQKRINMLVRDFLGTKEIGLANDYAEAVQRAGGAAKLTAADQAKVNRAVSDALAHYKALGQQAPAHLQAVADATKHAQIPADKLNATMATMKGVLGAFGIQLGLSSLVSFGKSVFNTADQIGDLALTMGVSTDAAQRFQYAARQSGAEVEDVTRALVQMNDRLAEGGKGTIAALTAAGLKFEDIRAMKPEDAFRAVSDAVGGIADPMRQTQVAMELFGKAGVQVLAMIREGSLKAADGVDVMSKDTIESLKKAQQAWENYWNHVVTLTGESIAKIAIAIENLKKILKGQFGDIKTGGLLIDPGGLEAIVEAERKRQAAAGTLPNVAPAGIEPFTVALRSAEDAVDRFDAKFGTADANLKKATGALKASEAAAAAEARYQAWKRAALGLSDAERELIESHVRLIREEQERGNGLPAVIAAQFKVNQGLEGITARMPNYISFLNITGALEKKKSEDLKHIAEALKSMTGLVNRAPTSSLLAGGISGADISKVGEAARLAGVEALNNKLRMTGELMAIAAQNGTGLFRAIATGAGNAVSMIGQYVVGMKAAKTAADAMAVSAQLAWGAATMGISMIVSGITSALADTAAANKEFKELIDAIKAFGANPVDMKWTAGQIGPLRKQLKELQDTTDKLKAKFGDLGQSLQMFGGVAPKALHGLVKELLTSKHLTADMRKELEAMSGAPTWQVMQERAEKLGIALSALGSNFSQARISDIALQYVRDLNMFSEAGADADSVLRGMADELSTVAQEAIASGAALPKTLEPYMKRLAEMGLLLDANGQLIDMGALSFKDIEDEALKQMVSFLEEIRDLLKEIGRISIPAPQVPVTGFGGMAAPRAPRMGFDAGPDWIPPMLPSFAGGTHGAYMDFGPGTPVMLHGQERVSTRGEGSGGTFNIYAIDAPSFETFLKQRGGAEAVVRSLPPVVERWGGAR